jgi:hypothetical protein
VVVVGVLVVLVLVVGDFVVVVVPPPEFDAALLGAGLAVVELLELPPHPAIAPATAIAATATQALVFRSVIWFLCRVQAGECRSCSGYG